MCKKSTTSITIMSSDSSADDEITMGMIKEGSSPSSGILKQYMRTPSSLSTASSDFEFDSCSFSELNNEPPLSPKLNYSPNWESALLASSNQNFPDRERAMKSSNVVHQDQHHGAGLSNEIKVNYERINGSGFGGYYSDQTIAEYGSLLKDYVGGDDQISRDIEGGHQEFSSLRRRLSDVISVNDGIHGEEQRRRVNLRSLLDRRDVEQLPPLTYKKDQKLQVSSSPSPSSSASSSSPLSPLHQCSDQYGSSTSPCSNIEDDHPSTPKSSEKKCKKWALKLDFLRRTVPSSRADNSNHQRYSSDQASNYGPNQRCSSDQASNYGLNQRCSSDLQASNYGFNESHGRISAAAEVDDQLNYSVAAAPAVITKFDSPRKSTGSSRHVSSSAKQAGRNVSRSAPISPAASPARSSTSAGGGAFTLRGPGTAPTSPQTRGAAGSPRWAPMSPHALHYQQQKARAEELRRKTFLPYRQSLLSACFFPGNLHSSGTPPPAPHHHHHPHSPAAVC